MKITNSKGEIYNTCPYLNKIKDFLIENNANSDLIEALETARAINSELRELSQEDKIIEYDEIKLLYCSRWDTSDTPLNAITRMEKEIDDLKKELKEYL